jgi:hypothetical protein
MRKCFSNLLFLLFYILLCWLEFSSEFSYLKNFFSIYYRSTGDKYKFSQFLFVRKNIYVVFFFLLLFLCILFSVNSFSSLFFLSEL